MGLKTYKTKRNFKVTSEPAGKTAKKKKKATSKRSTEKPHIFVVQKHDASHLHYDFRLEFDGVLKSWAVPKGPSLDPSQKRLAVEVEDHPLDYATFQGEIPEGQYGAGTVLVWDFGVWIPPKNTRAAFKKGHLDFELVGYKLKGKWTLVRLKSREGTRNNWLLIKRGDQEAKANYDILKKKPKSVLEKVGVTS